MRDLLTGRVPRDLDVSVDSEETAREVSQRLVSVLGGSAVVYGAFGTATAVIAGGYRVDICTRRREDYPSPGALPTVRAAGVVDDLLRRDFSVNSMALGLAQAMVFAVLAAPVATVVGPAGVAAPLPRRSTLQVVASVRRSGRRASRGLVDPVGGLSDLTSRRIRANRTGLFSEDPTRILRAYALRAGTGFTFCRATEAELHQSLRSGDFALLGGDRARDAILYFVRACLAETARRRGTGRLAPAGLLITVLGALGPFPWLSRREDNAASLARLLGALPGAAVRVSRILGAPLPTAWPDHAGGARVVPDLGVLGLAGLFWGAGEDATRTACRALALCAELESLTAFAAGAPLPRPDVGGARELAWKWAWTRLLGCDPARVDRAKAALLLAACYAWGPEAARRSLIQWMLAAGSMLWDDEKPGGTTLAEDLLNAGFQPGPRFGHAVAAARQARLTGRIASRVKEFAVATAYLRGEGGEGDRTHD